MKNNYFNLAILALLIVLIAQTCDRRKTTHREEIITRDTIWIRKDSVIRTKPTLVIQEPGGIDSVVIREYLPDTSCERLVDQYNALVYQFLYKNVMEDNLMIDSIGWVNVIDTVSRNMVIGRKYSYNLKYPTIKEILKVQEEPKRQLYVGGGLSGLRSNVVNEVSLGGMYKTKKDQLFGISGTYNDKDQFGIRLQSYWKIKL